MDVYRGCSCFRVQPVGNADNANYKVYVTDQAALDDSVTDIGTRSEPNMEAIAALKPDLIIANADNNSNVYDQLKAIAPTLEFDPYDGDGYNYDKMTTILIRLQQLWVKKIKQKKCSAIWISIMQKPKKSWPLQERKLPLCPDTGIYVSKCSFTAHVQ